AHRKMKKEGKSDKAKEKFFLGKTSTHTAFFILSGSADIGIVALSLPLPPNMKEKGRCAEILSDESPPIEQACVVLSSSKNKELAQQFLSFVKTAAVANLLRQYGFDVNTSSTK